MIIKKTGILLCFAQGIVYGEDKTACLHNGKDSLFYFLNFFKIFPV
jgi:hypothetical protein